MLRYALARLLSLAASLAVASVVIFVALEVVPGDPAAYMLGLNATPEAVAALRTELGLDAGPVERYLSWVAGMLRGDFGVSYTYRTPVAGMIADRLQVSLPLALYALALSTAIAFPVGIWAAARRGTAVDAGVMGATQLGVAVPNFWLAMLLVLVFAVNLRLFSAGGFPGWEGGLGPGLKALTLPAIALALPQASILARVMRSALIDTLGEDFVRTARAKGLTRGQALRRHALRNALIPVLTIIGLQFSFLLAGAIIIEQVFFLPGLGRLIFQAIASRDLIVVESVVMLLVFAVILVTFLVDLGYAAVDPRLRRR
jgi:peptide/nickel transport system permease protein